MKRFIENRPSSDTARRPLPPLAGNLLFLGALFAMSLLVMAIEKPLFLLWYHAQAAEASAAELALVVWNGLKLDQTVAGYITALPLLVVLAALWIPGRWSRSVLKGYLLVIAAVSATAFAANLALYEYWAFPLDSSVLQYLASPKEALASVTAGQLLLQLLVAAAVFGGMAWCYLRVLRLYDPARRSTHRAGSTLVLLLAAAAVFLVFYGLAQQTPSVPMSTVQQATHYVRGRVIEVTDNAWQGQQDYEDIPVGKQTVRVELRSGKYRGQVYELPNQLSYLYGTILKAGDAVTVAVTEEDGEISSMTLQDYDRTVPLALVVLAFLVVTVLVGRRVGAKSLLGLGLTVVCIFSILIPLLLGGWPTLPTILGMCAYVTVVEFVILGGVNRKTLCAILGTISGVAFAALFGELACALLRVNGYKMYSAEPTIEALLQIKQGQDPMHSLQLGDLLVGGIVIAALGAVNDVAMSISSAMNELVAVNPALTRRQLLRSGMNIGRDMVGTMTNTLILALVGSSLVLMIYLSSLEPSFSQLMSGTFFSVEMVQAIASSVGVILAVPLSALIGAFLFAKHKKENAGERQVET